METNLNSSQSRPPFSEEPNDLVISYLRLRKALGLMGFFLPWALILGSVIWFEGHIERSISAYFYTSLRDVFVVTLSAVALFLFTYKGYPGSKDWLVTNIAGFFGLLTAFIPTNFKCDIFLPAYKLVSFQNNSICPLTDFEVPSDMEPFKIIPSPQLDYIGNIHLACAAIFFAALAYMSYFQFTKSRHSREEIKNINPKKAKRNLIYRTCGIIMLVCIAALVPCFLVPAVQPFYYKYRLIFWEEAIALWAFGISWLVKGEFLIKDNAGHD